MPPDIALYVLAHGRRPARVECFACGSSHLEPIDMLIQAFGPLFPLDQLANYSYCRVCGGVDLRAVPG